MKYDVVSVGCFGVLVLLAGVGMYLTVVSVINRIRDGRWHFDQ